MIEGVKTKKLITHADERGWLFEILRKDDEIYRQFGQVYLSSVYPGIVKAWHCHARQYDNFCVVSGMIKLVLADLREDSPTKGEVNEFFIGDENRMLISIPLMVHHGVKGLGSVPALVLNCPTEPFNPADPDEIRLPYNTDAINYEWELKNG
ncbi:MAG: dTDP-4-dehydrorhamnose 3,5-epimerase family protein [candidate division Zixibacteria bacterium]|nr:dTDP-4-dehydrorhamnose 3,5-epimerase family protein [candidate division Zixibacteria bacterium]